MERLTPALWRKEWTELVSLSASASAAAEVVVPVIAIAFGVLIVVEHWNQSPRPPPRTTRHCFPAAVEAAAEEEEVRRG